MNDTRASHPPLRPEPTASAHPGDGGALGRRQFLGAAGVAAASLAGLELPVMAGPFSAEEWNQIIPADKKLHPDWVQSLFARGEPTVYTKSRGELSYIGMPVGGMCCGTLYLSGDGRLWNWDIFNQKIEGVLPRSIQWVEIGRRCGARHDHEPAADRRGLRHFQLANRLLQ